jgi:hypothetical protein
MAPCARGSHPGLVAEDSLVDQALASGLVQPDPTTCGSCSLVVARMIDDPSYAEFMVSGVNPATGEQRAGTIQARFEHEALAMHKTTSAFKDTGGRWQLPWPKALGTQPWALAREMTHEAGEKDTTYDARPIAPSQRSRTFSRIASLAAAGHVVPLFVGNRWSPRHVVLVLPGDQPGRGEVRIYDPASGGRYPISARDFAGGRLDVAGWQVPWVVVVPT